MLIANNETLTSSSEWQQVLCSPNYLLHSINVNAGVFEFVTTSKDRLSELSFLDGRVPLSESNETLELPIDEVLKYYLHRPTYLTHGNRSKAGINRFIFHMSFCGSTLMARTMACPGTAFCYKEPQILLQLAEIKAKGAILYQDRVRWKLLVGFVLSQLRRQWTDGEVTIIKPSNWLNSMLPELLFDGGDSKVVLLSTSRDAFLTSIFRGGGERVQFMYSVLRHLRTAFPEYSSLVAELEASSQNSIDLFAKLALVTHAIQTRAFSRVIELMPAADVFHFSYEQMSDNPLIQLERSSIVLQLGLPINELRLAISRNFAKHSKINHRGFDITEREQVNTDVNGVYSDSFDKALMWADRNLQLASLR